MVNVLILPVGYFQWFIYCQWLPHALRLVLLVVNMVVFWACSPIFLLFIFFEVFKIQ